MLYWAINLEACTEHKSFFLFYSGILNYNTLLTGGGVSTAARWFISREIRRSCRPLSPVVEQEATTNSEKAVDILSCLI